MAPSVELEISDDLLESLIRTNRSSFKIPTGVDRAEIVVSQSDIVHSVPDLWRLLPELQSTAFGDGLENKD